MEIIPAIDIIDGKCVRLTQGNYSQCKIYSGAPLEVAKNFEGIGLKRLHLVDLDGAKSAEVRNLGILEKICEKTSLNVDFGGGIKSDRDIRHVFEAGAVGACIGSVAQTDPERTDRWLELYGGEKIIIGADVWNRKVCIQGWKKVTDMTVFELVDRYRGKMSCLMCTDISRDGMLAGMSLVLYRELKERYPELRIIASGGVRDKADLQQLKVLGMEAVVVGKAFYENRLKAEEFAEYIDGNSKKVTVFKK